MARNNNNFLHKKTLITANSVTVESLDDSAEAYLRDIDSDLVKTVDNFPGGNIADGTISPDAIANQSEIVSGGGGLTSGGVLGSAIINRETYMNWEMDDAGPIDYSYFETYSPTGNIPANASNTSDYLSSNYKFYAKGQFWNALIDSGLAVLSPQNTERGIEDPVNEAYTFFTTSPSIPLLAKGNIRFNLNTVSEDTKALIKFFGVGAGADSDEIHSIQILDSANAGDPGAQLYRDEFGNEYYMTLLDSFSYNDISPFYGNDITYTGVRFHPDRDPLPAEKLNGIIEPPPYLIHTTDALAESDGAGNTIGDRTPTIPFDDYPNNLSWGQLSGGFKFFKGLKGIKLANNTGEFSTDPNDPTLQVRNKASRIRFKTRKSAGLGEVGASPSTYGQNASQIPIGQTVSNEVWSNVSHKFVYKVSSRKPMQGNFYGYATGGSGAAADLNKINFITLGRRRAQVFTGNPYTTRSGAASLHHGYLLGRGPGTIPLPNPLATSLQTTSIKFPFSSEYSYYSTNDLSYSTRIPLPAPQHLFNDTDSWQLYSAGISSHTHAHAIHNGFATKFPFAADNNVSDFTSFPSGLGITTNRTMGSNGDESNGYLWYQDTSGTPHPNSVRPIIKFPFATGTGAVFNTKPSDQWVTPVANVQSDTHGYGFTTGVGSDYGEKFSFANGTRTTLSPVTLNMPQITNFFFMAGISSTNDGYIYGGLDPTPSGNVITNAIRRFPFASETSAGNLGDLLSPYQKGAQHISF